MHLLRQTVLFTWLATLVLNVYIYNYPLFLGCGFPTKESALNHPRSPWGKLLKIFRGGNIGSAEQTPEFRLLAFADPQLEGDTSIWHAKRDALYRPDVFWQRLREADGTWERLGLVRVAIGDGITKGFPKQLEAWRKQIDLLGNDFYLAHVYRVMHRFSQPTHVTVLGDLLGSQWINDAEFSRRASRFWNRVFRGGLRIDDSITESRADEVLGNNAEHWAARLINIAGNHDVGYAGDLTEARLERFEKAFGRASWEMWLHSPRPVNGTDGVRPKLRIIVLNSMNLDTPVKSNELQTQTYEFLNRIITTSLPVDDPSVGTLLLTHIPLFKQEGVCVDGPFFDFSFEWGSNGVKEQNHLSYDAGRSILEGVYGLNPDPSAPGGGMGRSGLILNGHDHEGCDVYHYIPRNVRDSNAAADQGVDGNPDRKWNATTFPPADELQTQALPGIREVTLRSMMGEFGGYAYLLSAWYDEADARWRFEIDRCGAGVQHLWWAAHILLLVALGGLGLLVLVDPPWSGGRAAQVKRRKATGTKGGKGARSGR